MTQLEKAEAIIRRKELHPGFYGQGNGHSETHELAEAFIQLHERAKRLCVELQAPCMEYLNPEIQNAWSSLFELVESRREAGMARMQGD